MKLRKMFLLGLLFPLLVACNSQSIAGVYGFQLGKETGTHFGMSLALSDKAFVPSEGDTTVYESGLKSFKFSVSVKMDTEDSDTSSVIDSILDYFKDESGKATIPGYYKLTNDLNRQGERRIKLGLSFDYIAYKLNQILEEKTSQTIDPHEFDNLNDSKIIQNILCATHKDDVVNIYIPVSYQDLYYQLYWYGTDVKISLDLEAEEIEDIISFEVLDVEPKHAFGTLPTKAEIEEINKTFPAQHENTMFTEFKLFHQIKLGLLKK